MVYLVDVTNAVTTTPIQLPTSFFPQSPAVPVHLFQAQQSFFFVYLFTSRMVAFAVCTQHEVTVIPCTLLASRTPTSLGDTAFGAAGRLLWINLSISVLLIYLIFELKSQIYRFKNLSNLSRMCYGPQTAGLVIRPL